MSYAYDDWVSRGRMADCLLAYRDHWGPDYFTAVFLRPDVGVLRAYVDGEYYDVDLSAAVNVDEAKRKVTLRSILCRSRNYWPEIFVDGGPPSGDGGVSWLHRIEDQFRGGLFEISFENAVLRLFGPEWMAVVPLTAPRLADEDLAIADACDDMYRAAMAEDWFPWGRTVGLYDTRRIDAATTIQRFFRGWRVRRRTAWDPMTRLGRFYELREFERLMRDNT